MPKYRQLHVKILESFDFAEMPNDFTRLFWVLLPLITDRDGKGIATWSWIKAKMFPLRSDIDHHDIADAYKWLNERGMVSTYEVNNNMYFFIPNFKKYQSHTERETASHLPDPPGVWLVDHELVTENSGVTPELLMSNTGVIQELPAVAVIAVVNESESVNESVKKEQKPFFTIRNAEKVIVDITKLYPLPSEYIKRLEQVLDMLQHYGADETNRRLEKAWKGWCNSRTKDGRYYSKTNPAWIDKAIADESVGVEHKTLDEIKYEKMMKELENNDEM